MGIVSAPLLVRTVVYLPPSLREWLEREAGRRNLNLSAYVRSQFSQSQERALASEEKRAA